MIRHYFTEKSLEQRADKQPRRVNNPSVDAEAWLRRCVTSVMILTRR